MPDKVMIRPSTPDDLPAIEQLYSVAFPEEDLLELVRALIAETAPTLSLVAISDGTLAGHSVFTICGLEENKSLVGLLGPLAVAPDLQRRGIGTALVRDGLARLRVDGVAPVCVLGDPAYYGRLGFSAEEHILPPYALPPEWSGAWQAIGNLEMPCKGTLRPPDVWMQPALWQP